MSARQTFNLSSPTLLVYCPTIHNVVRITIFIDYISRSLYVNWKYKAMDDILVNKFVENIFLVNNSFVVAMLETQSKVFLLEFWIEG